jgi:hypothetical protein
VQVKYTIINTYAERINQMKIFLFFGAMLLASVECYANNYRLHPDRLSNLSATVNSDDIAKIVPFIPNIRAIVRNSSSSSVSSVTDVYLNITGEDFTVLMKLIRQPVAEYEATLRDIPEPTSLHDAVIYERIDAVRKFILSGACNC